VAGENKSEFRGVECPRCGCRHFFTLRTEHLDDGRIRRRKACRNCDRGVVTIEEFRTERDY